MKIDYDELKSESNRGKHGHSLSEADSFDWDMALERYDGREDYGEDRYTAIGLIANRVFVVVFVDREDDEVFVRRIISLRRASNREIDEYEKSLSRP